jgi:hypothetical protein
MPTLDTYTRETHDKHDTHTHALRTTGATHDRYTHDRCIRTRYARQVDADAHTR